MKGKCITRAKVPKKLFKSEYTYLDQLTGISIELPTEIIQLPSQGIGGQLHIGNVVHKGSISYVFEARFIIDGEEHEVIAKISYIIVIGTKTSSWRYNCNLNESINYSALERKKQDGCISDELILPKYYGYWDIEPLSILLIQKFGSSLDRIEPGLFSKSIIYSYARQLILLLERLHTEAKMVHIDIKPSNITIIDDKDMEHVTLVDYGLSHSMDMLLLFGMKESNYKREFTGTLNFAPIKAHRSQIASAGWDFESLAYTLNKLLFGELPWEVDGISLVDNHHYFITMKEAFISSDLNIQALLEESRKDNIDYGRLKTLFKP